MNNPPAFPQTCGDALDVGMVHEGMTLRDWFAGQALMGCLSGGEYAISGGTEEHIATLAYIFADAMLAARGDPQ